MSSPEPSSTENVQNKCFYCGNDKQDTVQELGYDQKDTSFETDIWCKNCGTVFTTHYDCTSFKQGDFDTLKKKYPNLAQDFKNADEQRRQNPNQPHPTKASTQVTASQLPSTETNKNDVERANQSEQETLKKAQTNRPQDPTK